MELGGEFCFDINSRDMLTGNALVHIAASVGNVLVLRYLLDKGASRDVENFQRETPLHIATRLNHTQVVRMLIFEDEVVAQHLKKEKRGMRPEVTRKRSPLKIMEEKRRAKYVQNLRRAMLSAKNHRGRTPHEIASLVKGYDKVIVGTDDWDGDDRGEKQKPRPHTASPSKMKNDNLLYMLDMERTAYGPKKGFFLGRPITAPVFRTPEKKKKRRGRERGKGKRLGAMTGERRPSTAGEREFRVTKGGAGVSRPNTGGGARTGGKEDKGVGARMGRAVGGGGRPKTAAGRLGRY